MGVAREVWVAANVRVHVYVPVCDRSAGSAEGAGT
jgi:hypothetical protein